MKKLAALQTLTGCLLLNRMINRQATGKPEQRLTSVGGLLLMRVNR